MMDSQPRFHQESMNQQDNIDGSQNEESPELHYLTSRNHEQYALQKGYQQQQPSQCNDYKQETGDDATTEPKQMNSNLGLHQQESVEQQIAAINKRNQPVYSSAFDMRFQDK